MTRSKATWGDDNKICSTEECYEELMNAIVLQAVTDWKDGWKRLKKNRKDTYAMNIKDSSESFFWSEWYKHLLDYPAEDLMAKLPEMAKAELLETTKRKYINAYKKIEELKGKRDSKAKQKKLKGAMIRKNEAEEDMRSDWFSNLYYSIPEEMIADCELIAEQEMAKEVELAKKTKHEIRLEQARKAREARSRKLRYRL